MMQSTHSRALAVQERELRGAKIALRGIGERRGSLRPFVSQWAVMLKTRKRDGSWVGTPVNLVVFGDRAYFATPATSAKVKRLRNFDEVEIAPCTLRGEPTGPALQGRARRLQGEDAERAHRLLIAKYRFVHRVLVPLELRLKGTHNAHYEVSGFRAT